MSSAMMIVWLSPNPTDIAETVAHNLKIIRLFMINIIKSVIHKQK